jgi:hypothetical protein
MDTWDGPIPSSSLPLEAARGGEILVEWRGGFVGWVSWVPVCEVMQECMYVGGEVGGVGLWCRGSRVLCGFI